ncbi:MAG: toxin-antitoxin system HicB family antitoxin [Thermodesulfobacteriota bacterium]
MEDYIELCRQAKKTPHKSYKGSFNVRVSPDIHGRAAAKAKQMGISLNKFVQGAIEHEVENKGKGAS